MRYKVIQEFPGLKVGDIAVKEGDFYTFESTEEDYSEDREIIRINSVALGQEVVEGSPEFFEALEEVEEVEETPSNKRVEELINDVMQVASLLEGDLVCSINEYHSERIQEMINKAYDDANFLSTLLN